MADANAQIKMKALVASRLLMGDINDWRVFEQERDMARKIANRHAARSVSSQIGRGYRELSTEIQKLIAQNFDRCNYNDLARLCDAIEPGTGLHVRLDEFEKAFFPLAYSVKRRFPFYAHVSISVWGLQFEYPEQHFLQDLDAGLDDLGEIRLRLADLGVTDSNMKGKRNEIAPLLSRGKFISRSIISASFSLVEAFLSGLFFTALSTRVLGKRNCDENFLRYAEKKESVALKDRLDRVVKFASNGIADGGADPFQSFIEVGKPYRDAIHHTTPFGRSNLETGERLVALYEINPNTACLCGLLSLDCVLTIANWIYSGGEGAAITDRCSELRQKALCWSRQRDQAAVG
jgi:hypothetical protein